MYDSIFYYTNLRGGTGRLKAAILYLFIVCVCAHVLVRRQLNGVSSQLLLCRFPTSNSGHGLWQQPIFSAEPIQGPALIFLEVHIEIWEVKWQTV